MMNWRLTASLLQTWYLVWSCFFSLARTQSTMLVNDTMSELRNTFDRLRRQWSLDLATQLDMK